MNAQDTRHPAVHTDVFDGPLELLLFLVRRDGIDLREVSIAPITDAYLAHLELMDQLDLDVAAEFVVMAATLCWLKSRELLPRGIAVSDDEEDPAEVRAELTRRLLEYQRYRDAADALASGALLDRDVFARAQDPGITYDRPVYADIDGMGLLLRYYRLLRKRAGPQPVHAIQSEKYDLAETAQRLLDRLGGARRDLNELLGTFGPRGERVMAFLAALELARLGMLDIEQGGHLEPILVEARGRLVAADLALLAGIRA
ncbi:MAG: segregation/condensation protein A [Deltaproteobacteria bacterium]|nr:segregation/condensation protein A [Deltaproteobacteria bacterium]